MDSRVGWGRGRINVKVGTGEEEVGHGEEEVGTGKRFSSFRITS